MRAFLSSLGVVRSVGISSGGALRLGGLLVFVMANGGAIGWPGREK
jgi:hypothetical protein